MRKLLLSCLALLLVAALPAVAQPPGGPPMIGPSPSDLLGVGDLVDPGPLAFYLQMSEEQIDAALDLFGAYQVAAEPIRTELEALETQLRDLLAQDDPPAEQVGVTTLAIRDQREALRGLAEGYRDDFLALLTPEQGARFEQMLEVLRVVRVSQRHDGPPPPPPPADE